jgi:uncharacterized protein (DUF1810 family)
MFEHFVDAQQPIFATVEAELRAGRKRSHWMWFIFPQLVALGRSATAKHFGLKDLADARAYAAHPLLGQRLRHCVTLVNALEGRSAHELFSFPDELKFRSCATLFLQATGEDLFAAALAKYYGGEEDPLTLEELRRAGDI